MTLKLSSNTTQVLATPEWKRRQNVRRLRFRGQRIFLKANPRTGVCNECRAVTLTHIHHERYDQNSPLSHTIELCAKCHGRKLKKGTQFVQGQYYNKCKNVLNAESNTVVRLVQKFRRC